MPNRIKRWNGEDWVTIYDEAVLTKNIFSTIQVSGQSDIVADATTDVLTLASGTGLAITTNAGTDTITFASNGTSSNTANTLVLRDGSGNFSAGGITATSFSGGGGSLTGLNATELTIGTVPSARLSGTYGSVTGVGTLASLTVGGTSTFNGTTLSIPTDGSNLVLGANATSGDRLRLHRSGANSYVDFSGNLHFRSEGDSEDVVVQNNGVTRIARPSHTYCGNVEQSVAQAMPDITWRPIIWNEAGVDYAAMHDHTATGAGGDGWQLNTRIVIPIAGFWKFWAQAAVADSINGRRYVQIRRYDSAGTLQQRWASVADAGDTGADLSVQCVASFECAANDYIQVWYYHNSGASRNTIVAADTSTPETGAIRPKVGWMLIRATP